MALQIPNPTNVGADSAHYLAAALNTYGKFYLSNATSTDELGAVVAEPPTKTFQIFANVSDAFGAGESLTLVVRYLDSDGTAVFKTALTLNATTASAAGEVEGPKIVLPGIKPGHVLQIVRTYVAGTPNDPEVSLVCQLV